jgi:phosphatidylglycerophosphate synthase
MRKLKSHDRINDILLGSLERPALQWLAAHMPPWMTPDILTVIGAFGAVVIFSGYVLTHSHKGFLWLASFGFLINWFGDSLDGTLARYRKIERPKYGYFVDHTVDSFNEMIILLGLGLSLYMRFEIAAMILIGYLLMSILVFIRTSVTGEFRISYGKLGPTEVRVIAVILNTLIFFFGNPTVLVGQLNLSVVDMAGGVVALVLIGIYVFSSWKEAARLHRFGE